MQRYSVADVPVDQSKLVAFGVVVDALALGSYNGRNENLPPPEQPVLDPKPVLNPVFRKHFLLNRASFQFVRRHDVQLCDWLAIGSAHEAMHGGIECGVVAGVFVTGIGKGDEIAVDGADTVEDDEVAVLGVESGGEGGGGALPRGGIARRLVDAVDEGEHGVLVHCNHPLWLCGWFRPWRDYGRVVPGSMGVETIWGKKWESPSNGGGSNDVVDLGCRPTARWRGPRAGTGGPKHLAPLGGLAQFLVG